MNEETRVKLAPGQCAHQFDSLGDERSSRGEASVETVHARLVSDGPRNFTPPEVSRVGKWRCGGTNAAKKIPAGQTAQRGPIHGLL